jgi:hypothetical protein
MTKWFVVFSGTGIAERREGPMLAREALERVLDLMRLRRPGVRIEDEQGAHVSFFQLKEAAQSGGIENVRRPSPRSDRR